MSNVNEFKYTNLNDAVAVITGYYGKGSAISIPSRIGRYEITGIGMYAFQGCNNLVSVSLPDSVKVISDCAFRNCKSLRNIDLGAVSIICYQAFSGCIKLESLRFPDSVDRIDCDAFSHCIGLEDIYIPEYTSALWGNVFSGCRSLKNISVHNNNRSYTCKDGVLFNLSKNTLFCYPAGKPEAEYNVPNTVTYIFSDAFSGCSKLLKISIPDSVTTFGSKAFSGCSNLQQINLPKRISVIPEEMFSGCSSLEIVNLPNCITKIAEGAFWKCSKLKQINIPGSVNSIGSGAFSGCANDILIEYQGALFHKLFMKLKYRSIQNQEYNNRSFFEFVNNDKSP